MPFKLMNPCGVRDGRTKYPEYETWVQMQRRCYDPIFKSFADYGGRGITVCMEWRLDYLTFLRDMGRKPSPKHSLDRKNNEGNYEPGNCRWATSLEQKRNRRGVHKIEFQGQTKCLREWADIIGIPRHSLRLRLDRMPIDQALNTAHPLPKLRPEPQCPV